MTKKRTITIITITSTIALAIVLGFLPKCACEPKDNAGKPLPTPKKEEGDDPLVGVWRFAGEDVEHSLTGTVSIWKKGEVYLVQWSGAAEAGDSFGMFATRGIGLRQGDVFSVAWRGGEAGGGFGVSVFKITDKHLEGKWTSLPGGGNTMSENWIWLAPHIKRT
jgi:hypothetical protein